MELITHSLCSLYFPNPSASLSPSISLPCNHFLKITNSNFLPNKKLLLQCCNAKPRKQRHYIGTIRALAGESSLTDDGERWLLEPVGDGDSRHIGFKVPIPGAFEITSSEVTVGRVPEKADIVIPVATVSAQHARIQNKGGDLLVTDLDSTNGTFIDEKRLTPGVTAAIPPGRYITFGDTNLAIFRVSKLEKAQLIQESGKAELTGESGD